MESKFQNISIERNHCALLSSRNAHLEKRSTCLETNDQPQVESDDWLNLCWDDFDAAQHYWEHGVWKSDPQTTVFNRVKKV